MILHEKCALIFQMKENLKGLDVLATSLCFLAIFPWLKLPAHAKLLFSHPSLSFKYSNCHMMIHLKTSGVLFFIKGGISPHQLTQTKIRNVTIKEK